MAPGTRPAALRGVLVLLRTRWWCAWASRAQLSRRGSQTSVGWLTQPGRRCCAGPLAHHLSLCSCQSQIPCFQGKDSKGRYLILSTYLIWGVRLKAKDLSQQWRSDMATWGSAAPCRARIELVPLAEQQPRCSTRKLSAAQFSTVGDQCKLRSYGLESP